MNPVVGETPLANRLPTACGMNLSIGNQVLSLSGQTTVEASFAHETGGNEELVSIGLPVFNGGAHLNRALAALTEQTHRHIELMISDNASDDTTESICQQWAARDRRIQYVRQSSNIGPVANFRFLLSQARARYFMWAAHDDWWHPDFVRANLAELCSGPDVIGSVSEVDFVDLENRVVPFDAGTQPMLADPHTNLLNYLRRPAANSRFYGLFRTDVLRRCFHETDNYWAGDWAVMARTLVFGKHALVRRRLMRRGLKGISSDMARSIPRFNRTWLSRRFPLLPLTRAIWSDRSIPKSLGLLRVLAGINLAYWRHSCGLVSTKALRHRYLYPIAYRFGWKPRLKNC